MFITPNKSDFYRLTLIAIFQSLTLFLSNAYIDFLVYDSLFLAALALLIMSLRNAHQPLLTKITKVALYSTLVVKTFELVSYEIQGDTFTPSFFYHFNLESAKASSTFSLSLFAGTLALLTIALIDFLILSPKTKPTTLFLKDKTGKKSLLSLFIFLTTISLCWNSFLLRFTSGFTKNLPSLVIAKQTLKDKGLSEIFTQKDWSITQKSKKNLILVYLESLENSFFTDPSNKNLLNKLSKLKSQSVDFQNVSQKKYTKWTIAGMFASQCAVPLVNNGYNHGNDIINYQSNNLLTCLGNILNKAGYHQVFLQGTSTTFSGIETFYRASQYDEIIGNNTLNTDNAKHSWGLHDEDMFEAAKKKISLLQKMDKPFNLTLSTFDTHAPGYPSKNCPLYQKSENQIIQAAHCLDYLVEDFVNHLRNEKVLDDTVVVFLSDHLTFRLYKETKNRRLSFFIVSPNQKSQQIQKSGDHYDISPTILNQLGIETSHNMFPLGADLLDSKASKPVLDESASLAIATVLRTSPGNKLCGKTINIDFKKMYISIGSQKILISMGNGTNKKWRKDHYYLLKTDSENRIVFHNTMNKDDALTFLKSDQNAFSYLIVGNNLDSLLPRSKKLFKKTALFLDKNKKVTSSYSGQTISIETKECKSNPPLEDVT